MSAYRSADPELQADDAVADLLHAETFEAAASRALARAEVRASAVQAEHEGVADRADRVDRADGAALADPAGTR